MPLLTSNAWRTQLSRSIESALDEAKFDLVAFVFMPDHVHLIVYPHGEIVASALSRFLARAKQPFSKYVKSMLAADSSLLAKLTFRERPSKICFRFWQEGPGYDRNLTSPAAVEASIAYIHNNPVRRGLCERAIDWKWSSARWYLDEPARQQDPDLPRIAGVPVGLLD
jgi:putative transposase